MYFDISAWSIKNPTPTTLLFILLTLMGLFGLNEMKVQNFPDIDLPTISLIAVLPGASPIQLENDVARKLENSIASIQGVKHISSTLNDGRVNIVTEFHLEKPIQEALSGIRDAVSRVRTILPADLRDPMIKKMDISDGPILTYTISSSVRSEQELSWFIDSEINRTLLSIPGVGAVTRVGGVDREIRVNLDPSRLIAFNTSADEISNQLRHVQQESPGGLARINTKEQAIRVLATVKSAEQVGAIDIPLRDGRRVRINQIATVTDSHAEKRSAVLLNGVPVVGFEISRTRGASELEVSEKVRDALLKLKRIHPELTLTEALNNIDSINENYHGSWNLLYEGAALAILAVFLFLANWRATLISALALPLSAIPTFAVIYWLGFTLNTVTLLSISLMIGILVDDTIVEVENIQRHLLMGKTPYQAALDASGEIGFAVIATTLTLIAVFLPTAFMSGVIGKFFLQFGWTAAISVFFSLVVARMATPMMAAYLLHPSRNKVDHTPEWISRYLGAVNWCLRNRLMVLASSVVLLTGSIGIAALIPMTFMPPEDNRQTQITLTLPIGSKLSETLTIAEDVRKQVDQNPNVSVVYTTIGSGNTGADPIKLTSTSAANIHTAILTVILSKRDERPGVTKQEIEGQLRFEVRDIPGVRIKVGSEDSESFGLVLTGEDGKNLEKVANQVSQELHSIPQLGSITSTLNLVRPELQVRPDFAHASRLGVTTEGISNVLRVATNGDYVQDLAKLNISQRQIPIVVRLSEEVSEDINVLKRLPVQGINGMVPLESVASLELSSGPSEVVRYDRMRNVNFEIDLNGLPLSEVRKMALATPTLQNLPEGVHLSLIGDAEALDELASGFRIAMLTGGLCIYIILVLLFKDFIQPLTLLVALLMSIPGAVLALLITHTQLSMPALIGLIMLMGITTKNSILLIDYIILAKHQQGISRLQAVLDGCKKRVRPIVMTTIAMGAGMLPIAFGWGADPSFRAPMAIVVVGGLITSTILSLLLVPVLFTYMDDLVQFTFKRTSEDSSRQSLGLN